jgi:hypothetical protein
VAKKHLHAAHPQRGRRFVVGEIQVEAAPDIDNALPGVLLPGLQVPREWDGNDATLEFTLDTNQVPLGGHSGALLLISESETVRVPVSYTVEPLRLRVEPDALDFGNVLLGQRISFQVSTRREGKGRGEPRGVVYKGELKNLVVPERFSGESPFEVTVDASLPDTTAKSYAGVLQLDTNGGRLRVPVLYRIALPPRRLLGLLLGSALGGALAMGLLRLATQHSTRIRFALVVGTGQGAQFEIRSLGPLVAALF